MKKQITILVLSLMVPACLSAGPIIDAGANGLSFFLEPSISKGLGGTAYDLSFPWAPGVTGSSRLEFPQLQLEAGALLGLTIDRGGKRSWLIEAGVFHSFLAMPGSMYDYDWIQFAGYPRIPFSYTYSSDSTTCWSLSIEAAWSFLHAGPFDLALYGTYRYQNDSHVENGYTGWQWDPATLPDTTVYLIGSSQPDALEYTLSAHIPGIGLFGSLQVFRGASLDLRAAYTPVYVSDSDDHRLRTKLSTASGWGNGVYADLRGTYRFARFGKVTPYVVVYGIVLYYVVSTTQTQYWYGDADENVPQGTRITGVDHVITSSEFRLGIRMGFSL
jgi:hypothetical protein